MNFVINILKNVVINSIGIGNVLKIRNAINPFKIKEIILDISASYNAKCPFCPRLFMPEERAKGFMSLELYTKILEDAKNNGINTLRLYSTAEPTMHPNFDKIINIAKEKGFKISLSTNGSLIHKYMDSIAKVDALQYSIEGWDKESYEKYRIPLKFERVFENIKEFHKYLSQIEISPQISINLLITKNTNIKNFINLWEEYVDKINIHFMYKPVKYEDGKFIEKEIETQEEYFDLSKQVKDFYCAYPFEIITVAFDGKIALCCDDFAAELGLGNLKYMTIKEALSSKKLYEIKKQFFTQKLDLCKECSRFSQPKLEDIELIRNSIDYISKIKQKKIYFNY